MRKQGPCDHCGVAESPLWRNGPAEKPVLCNACGSRWRLRRSLRNYVPNHSYVLRKRKLRKNDTDFCYYDNVVKIEEDGSLCSDGIQTSDKLLACPNLKSSSRSAISDQPTVKIEPVGEDENSEGAGIDQPCVVEVPSENWHFSHIEDLHRNLWDLYANRCFASSYEPKEMTLIYHHTPLALSVGEESTLGVVLLEPSKVPKKEVSKALPLLLGADISIVETPKRRKTPSKNPGWKVVESHRIFPNSKIKCLKPKDGGVRLPSGNDTFFSPTIFPPFRQPSLSTFLGLVCARYHCRVDDLCHRSAIPCMDNA